LDEWESHDLLTSTPTRGQRVGRFLVLSHLGQGGMGVVVEAHDEQLDRTVALKLLHVRAAGRQRARLLREAQALARLSHPNVVQIYEVGLVGGRTFIAMELVRGQTLRRWAEQPRSWRATVGVYLQAARGLAAAHDKELIHRDFKPDNCIIGDEGRVRVLDFGLARDVSTAEEPPETNDTAEQRSLDAGRLSSGGHPLTQEGDVIGTMAYMSSEQMSGIPATASSDQYSFCASLFEALYGTRLRPSCSRVRSSSDCEPRSPVRVPGRLRRAMERGLSADPAARWPSMAALIEELEAVLRRRRWSVGVALGLGVALGGGLALTRSTPPPPPACPELATVLAGTWGEEGRERVRAAFERHGPEREAEVLPARVVDRLERYASAWAGMAHESCVATFVERRQSETMFDQRARCLERRRNRFLHAVDALAEAEDETTLVHRVILPFKLPGLQGCTDVDALASLRPEEGGTPEQQAQREALRRRIDEASGLRESGELALALERAEAARDEATALGDPGLRAEALECLGRIQAEGAALGEAGSTLEQAILAAGRANDDRVAARAWLSLMYANIILGELTAVKHHTLAATVAVEAAGDELLRAWLLNNLGILASEESRDDAAQEYFEDALDIKTRLLGPDHVDVGIALSNLGAMLTNAERHAKAQEVLERAGTIFEATVGESHPMNAHVLASSCYSELGQGDLLVARARCREALERFGASDLGMAWVGRVTLSLAKAEWALGNRDAAVAVAVRARDRIEAENPNEAAFIERWLMQSNKELSELREGEEEQ